MDAHPRILFPLFPFPLYHFPLSDSLGLLFLLLIYSSSSILFSADSLGLLFLLHLNPSILFSSVSIQQVLRVKSSSNSKESWQMARRSTTINMEESSPGKLFIS